MIAKADGGFQFVGVFLNVPRPEQRPSNPIHYGAFRLDVDGPPNGPRALIGEYWTTKGTKGSLTATGRKTRRA